MDRYTKQYLKYKTKYVVGGAILPDDMNDMKIYQGTDKPLYEIGEIVTIRVRTIEGDTVYPAGTITGRIIQYIESGETFQYLINIGNKVRLYCKDDIER
jgi:hypothetical protein